MHLSLAMETLCFYFSQCFYHGQKGCQRELLKMRGKRLRSYWVNTSGNELAKKNIIIKTSFDAQEKIAELIAGNI